MVRYPRWYSGKSDKEGRRAVVSIERVDRLLRSGDESCFRLFSRLGRRGHCNAYGIRCFPGRRRGDERKKAHEDSGFSKDAYREKAAVRGRISHCDNNSRVRRLGLVRGEDDAYALSPQPCHPIFFGTFLLGSVPGAAGEPGGLCLDGVKGDGRADFRAFGIDAKVGESAWLILCTILLLVFLAVGSPVFVAFVLFGGLVMLLYLGMPFEAVAHLFFCSVDKPTLLAIPFFILAGTIMNSGGLSKRLIDITDSFVGHLPGGMGLSVIAAAVIFGALSGSHAATAVAIGSMMIPRMVEIGYERRFCGVLVCNSTTIGILIPPTVAAIIYGYATGMSVGKLFMAGVFPGLLMAVFFSVGAVWLSWRRGYPISTRATWKMRANRLLKGVPALLMPVIVLGGIYSGVFTAVEAAAAAVFYAFVVGIFFYKELTLTTLWQGLTQAVVSTANIYFLIASAMIVGKILVLLGVPQTMTNMMVSFGFNSMSFTFLAMASILVLGTFLEAAVLILVTMPIFMPIMEALGTNPYMFYAMMTIMIGVGQVTPPVGIVLYIMSDVSGEPVESLFRESLIWLAVLLGTAVIVVLFPSMSSWLPDTMW